uniref:Uncharacterized protein n=1 Tax=Fopius arisanus TaxID=64838 RepID=A0A0C9QXQ4_9HYME
MIKVQMAILCSSFKMQLLSTDYFLNFLGIRYLLLQQATKKFGALVLVRQGERLKEFDTATYNATALFGAGSDKQEESILAAAKYIAQSIDIDRNLLLSIALSTYDKKVLDSVIAAIKKFKTW